MVKEFGYEYDARANEDILKETKGKVTFDTFHGALCLRSGRDALKVVSREFTPRNVFMPALSCDSMCLPFEMYGHNLCFYKYDESYHIDLNYLDRILTDHSIFLYMDYFGNKSINDKELYNLKEKYPDLIFVEDRTHTLIWDEYHEFNPDYTIASIRKWINCPDGGLLWTNRKLSNSYFEEDTLFAQTRLKAQCMRNEYFKTGNETIKSEYRRIFSTVTDSIDSDMNPGRMSDYSYQLLLKTDFTSICKIRQENAEKLIEILKDADVQFIQNQAGISDLYVAFKIENRTAKQNILSSKGIFDTIIWPLTDKQKDICPVAKETEEHMLAAPCDQRYTIADMEYIGKEIVKVING